MHSSFVGKFWQILANSGTGISFLGYPYKLVYSPLTKFTSTRTERLINTLQHKSRVDSSKGKIYGTYTTVCS